MICLPSVLLDRRGLRTFRSGFFRARTGQARHAFGRGYTSEGYTSARWYAASPLSPETLLRKGGHVGSMFLAFAFKWPSIQLAMYASYALLCRKPTMLLMEKVRSSPLTNDFVILQFRSARPARRDLRYKRMQGRSISVRLSLTYCRPISVRTLSWNATSTVTRGDTVKSDQLI